MKLPSIRQFLLSKLDRWSRALIAISVKKAQQRAIRSETTKSLSSGGEK